MSEKKALICQYCMGEGTILRDRYRVLCGHCEGARVCSTICVLCIHILANRDVYVANLPKLEHHLVDKRCVACMQLADSMGVPHWPRSKEQRALDKRKD